MRIRTPSNYYSVLVPSDMFYCELGGGKFGSKYLVRGIFDIT